MLCLNFSIAAKLKNLFLILYFVYQVIKKRNDTLGTQIVMVFDSFLATNCFWWNSKIKTTIDH